jgi:hypothetical protein
MTRFVLTVSAMCFLTASAMAFASPASADGERVWNGDEVAAIATQLDELVRGIRDKIEFVDSTGDVLKSRRTAVARATLGKLEKSTQQLAATLRAGATRESTLAEYERLRGLRQKLSQQSTEEGFAEPAIDLIVKARGLIVQLDGYYRIDSDS